VYFAGDTDLIPEMKDINCDIALLPVSGTYVMTVKEAVQAAQVIRPEIVIPMHYGAGIGTKDDGLKFQDIYSGKVILLKKK
jgi:L-ascorbate metabolism protein UlaG (beta-lactamase superfamily)